MSEVARDRLGEFMHSVKVGAFDGLNVTIPYKTDVLQYLDEISAQAEKIGAVNTIKRAGDSLHGFNTDYDGFGALLEANYIDVKDVRFTVLGAAARRGVFWRIWMTTALQRLFWCRVIQLVRLKE